jgi:hypothetical protein
VSSSVKTLGGHRFLSRKDRSNLGPKIAAERLRFHRRQHDRHVEHAGGLGESDRVVDDRLTIAIAGSEQHLRLMVDHATTQLSGVKSPFSLSFGRSPFDDCCAIRFTFSF